jgi:hypothetical protein
LTLKTSPSSWACVLGAAALAASSAARADLLVHEPFDYEAGTFLDGQAATGLNLAGTYSDPVSPSFRLVAASPGLTYGALAGPLPATSGNRLSQTSGTTNGSPSVQIDQDVPIDAGGTIYFSALVTLDDSSNGNRLASVNLVDDATGHQITFGEPGVGVRDVRIAADMTSTGGPLIAAGADAAFTSGQTLWLIGRYTNGAAPASDALDLIGYDTAGAFAAAPSFDPADPNAQFAFSLADLDFNLARISSLQFIIRGDSNIFLEELRFGETYADVTVRAPAGAALLAVAGFGLVPRRRTRRPRLAAPAPMR